MHWGYIENKYGSYVEIRRIFVIIHKRKWCTINNMYSFIIEYLKLTLYYSFRNNLMEFLCLFLEEDIVNLIWLMGQFSRIWLNLLCQFHSRGHLKRSQFFWLEHKCTISVSLLMNRAILASISLTVLITLSPLFHAY